MRGPAAPRAHPAVREVLDRCAELRTETRGYFDDRFDGSLDPSGLVKGSAVDAAADILDAFGLRNHAVNAGGDIRVRGGALPESTWRTPSSAPG